MHRTDAALLPAIAIVVVVKTLVAAVYETAFYTAINIWWRWIRVPRFVRGQVVHNRWVMPGRPPRVLLKYLGPDVDYRIADAPGPTRYVRIVQELWLTESGSRIAVGYFWAPLESTRSEPAHCT